MYIADGTNIRAVDPKGIIHTLIGNHGHHNHWSPIPCRGAIPATQVNRNYCYFLNNFRKLLFISLGPITMANGPSFKST